MSEESSFEINLGVSKQDMINTVDGAHSIRDIEEWFEAQPRVNLVKLAEYILKSNPPQLELFVEFTTLDGTTLPKVINFFDLGNGRYQFNEIRDRE